ncbi:YidB family protein [Streptomyces sp. NPDC046237]|uniref:YidB family protein n=1 Tax=Streptomyces sp. NPDC046237 TaxID=3154914 RepID=UPI0033F2A5AB
MAARSGLGDIGRVPHRTKGSTMAGNDLAAQIAQVLPQAVAKLTPAGQVPTESLEDIIRRQRL